jgi:hypothetical protein
MLRHNPFDVGFGDSFSAVNVSQAFGMQHRLAEYQYLDTK